MDTQRAEGSRLDAPARSDTPDPGDHKTDRARLQANRARGGATREPRADRLLRTDAQDVLGQDSTGGGHA